MRNSTESVPTASAVRGAPAAVTGTAIGGGNAIDHRAPVGPTVAGDRSASTKGPAVGVYDRPWHADHAWIKPAAALIVVAVIAFAAYIVLR